MNAYCAAFWKNQDIEQDDKEFQHSASFQKIVHSDRDINLSLASDLAEYEQQQGPELVPLKKES